MHCSVDSYTEVYNIYSQRLHDKNFTTIQLFCSYILGVAVDVIAIEVDSW